jgi:hypothetical protein
VVYSIVLLRMTCHPPYMVHQPIVSNNLSFPNPELAIICDFDFWMLLQTPVILFCVAS